MLRFQGSRPRSLQLAFALSWDVRFKIKTENWKIHIGLVVVTLVSGFGQVSDWVFGRVRRLEGA